LQDHTERVFTRLLKHLIENMNGSNYRKLVVWQKARVLAVRVYRGTRRFPREEMFGLVQQMRRAAISILCNIAEGQGRWTRPDYAHFLIQARGSALELEAQIVISADLEFLEATEAADMIDNALEVCRMLNGLLRHARSAKTTAPRPLRPAP
jgi:four helix bundle protein